MKEDKNDSAPIFYVENTREERVLLRLADNFLRQFAYLYPDRAKPPLYLQNEHGVEKLVCTTLCPLKVLMPVEMRKWDFCAKYFAEYFDYEVLETPTAAPDRLSSLDGVLARRKGNALDLSSVLCTFLLAANYDAYVVQGYARRSVCRGEVPRGFRPPVRFDSSSEYHRQFFTPRGGEVAASKYQLDFERVKSFWLEGERGPRVEDSHRRVTSEDPSDEEDLLGERVHFWVLVCRYEGGRVTSFMIEPTTGEEVATGDRNYLAVEFAWNDSNFWCNKQRRFPCCELVDFDFDDAAKWEPFLPEGGSGNGDGEEALRMPGTWVRDVQIRPEDLDSRYPEGGRVVEYWRATVEKYNLNHLKSGLVYKVKYFGTEKKDDPLESHAFYRNRLDLLEYRRTDHASGVVDEVFAEGRKDALRRHSYPVGNRLSFPQKLEFYSTFRDDGLSSRAWNESVTVDEFSGRDDSLVEREVHYLRPDVKDAGSVATETDQTRVQQPETEIHAGDELPDKEKSIAEDLSQEKSSESADSTTREAMDESVSSSEIQDSKPLEELGSSKESLQKLPSSSIETLKETEADAKEEDSTYFDPGSFDSVEDALKGIDFSKWTYKDFLANIDPAEKYATSESDSEEESKTAVEGDVEETAADEDLEDPSNEQMIAKDNLSETIVNKRTSEDSNFPTAKNDSYKRTGDSAGSAKKESFQEMFTDSKDDRGESDDQTKTDGVGEDATDISSEVTDPLDPVEKTESDMTGVTDVADQLVEIEDRSSGKTDQADQVEETQDVMVKTFDEAGQVERTDDCLTDETALIDLEKETSLLIKNEDEDELDEEMELYDEINFDELSDEELELDYQLFLSKLWREYTQDHKKEIFYMSREFQYHKDLRRPDILRLKKKITRKRRNNLRYLQRVESGKPDVRVHKKKMDEVAGRQDSIYTKDLITHLRLDTIIGGDDITAVRELCPIEKLEASDEAALLGEIIKKEALKFLDAKTRNGAYPTHGAIATVMQTYQVDRSRPSRLAFECEWFDFATDCYRLDFPYEQGKSSRRVLYFSKPESGLAEFSYADYLCREIVPTFETERTRKCQLYAYLSALMRKEPRVVRECERFEREMERLIEARRGEETKTTKIKVD